MAEPAPSSHLRGGDALRHPLLRELLAARLVCVLATYDEGWIHAVPMWFAAEEGAVLLATGSRSRKVRNLERDPRASLVVHDSRAGYEVCGALLTGRAEVVRGAAARPLVARVHRRYVDPACWDEPPVRAFLASDDVALRLAPERALVWDERGSAAAALLRARGGALPLLPTAPRPG
ncbi:MAG TPA: pyridoxamine 5'-phosphate oxidase family protein [Gaiellaceae bacterium]|nr:pyridoxamine 5'-phosphate oxidase family protein [Gaiellaceae bacterium]